MNARINIFILAGALIAASNAYAQTGDQGTQAPITVYGKQLTGDQRITRDVMSKISADSRISGNIGVETDRGEVTLTGLVSTPIQAYRAGLDAQSADGVKAVHDEVHGIVGENF